MGTLLKHFPWMHDARIQTPDMANVNRRRLIFRVQTNDDKHLTIRIRQQRLQQLIRIRFGA